MKKKDRKKLKKKLYKGIDRALTGGIDYAAPDSLLAISRAAREIRKL